MKKLLDFAKAAAPTLIVLLISLFVIWYYAAKYNRLLLKQIDDKISVIRTDIATESDALAKMKDGILETKKSVADSYVKISNVEKAVSDQAVEVSKVKGLVKSLENKAEADLADINLPVTEAQNKLDVKEIEARLKQPVLSMPNFSISLTGGQLRAENSLFRASNSYVSLSRELSTFLEKKDDQVDEYKKLANKFDELVGKFESADAQQEVRYGKMVLLDASMAEKVAALKGASGFFKNFWPSATVGVIVGILVMVFSAK